MNGLNQSTSQNEPDLLAGAVLNSLTRPLYYPLAWGVLPTFLACIVTGGVLPMLMIPKWLKGIIAQHQQQFWHLAEWLRLQNADPDAVELQNASRRVRYNFALAVMALICALGAIIPATLYFQSHTFDPPGLYTFAFTLPTSPEAILFTLALVAAAVFNWIHVAWDQRNVASYLAQFNRFAPRYSLDPIPSPKTETGLRPLWILAGIALSANGALWPLFVMLAAGAHRRYTLVRSVKLRAMLAERMRAILLDRQPPLRMPRPVPTVIRACVRPNCKAALPSSAVFCPRCGTRTARAVDIVA